MKTQKLINRITVFLLSISVIFCIGGSVSTISPLSDGEMEYYNFSPIADLSTFQVDQIVYLSTGAINPASVVTALPDGTAVLKVTSGIQPAGTNSGYNCPAEEHIKVDVLTRGWGFDNCPGGYLYIRGGQITYNCNGGAVVGLTGYNGQPYVSYECEERPLGSGWGVPEAPSDYVDSYHEHSYSWREERSATEDEAGEMIYVCDICGQVQYRSATSAYAVFNQKAVESIEKASQNAVVPVKTRRWISFHRMVLEALCKRPDVTLDVTFLSDGYKGDEMNVVIPAGVDIDDLLNGEDYCGFLYLRDRKESGSMKMADGTPALVATAATDTTTAPAAATDTTTAPAATTDAAAPATTAPASNTITNTSSNNTTVQGTISGDTISIPYGVDSYYVAKLLERAGKIESAREFDRFLCSNGYDRRILAGTRTIPSDSGFENIARILTNAR